MKRKLRYHFHRTSSLSSAGVIASLVVALSFFPLSVLIVKYLHYQKMELTKIEEQRQAVRLAESYKNLSLEAKSFVVYDIASQSIIAGNNETKQLPLASLTKLMTALTALSLAGEDTKIIVHKTSLVDGKYDLGLKDKQVWTLGELIKYTLTLSSNDGAQIIADNLLGRGAFIQAMNKLAHEISPSLTFTSPSGLDAGNVYGGVGTADDVARIVSLFYTKYPELFDATTHDRVTVQTASGPLSGVPNTNTALNQFVGLSGSKTGFTDLAGGNLAIVFDASLGRPVVIVVLGSSKEGRFKDVKALYDLTKRTYRSK